MPFSPLNSGFLSPILATNSKMQSQNTPSPQNKIEMKSTNLIFTLLLLRFPVFLLLQSSVFSFGVYTSCLFRVSSLLLSLVPKVAKPKEIKSLRFFFSFSNKVVYQYGRHYPFPIKRLDMLSCFHHSFAFRFFLNHFHLIAFFYKTFKYLIALCIGTTNPHIHMLNSCVIVN